MRIHVQNDAHDPHFAITPAQWAQAAELAGEPAHAVSFGDDPGALAAALQSAEMLIAGPATLAAHRPLAAPHLRLIFCTAAGVDRLLPLDWLPAGAALLNNRGAHGAKVGEYVAMALLMLGSGLPAMLRNQRAHAWRPLFTPTLRDRQVVVVGAGDLGGAAAGAARRFGARVTGVRASGAPHPDFDRMVAADALDSVLPGADFLVLACPLTDATRHLLDARRLALLPRHAGVVNVGRGALLDQAALAAALREARLGGAVLDVVSPEPLPAGDPLWDAPNLILTPHVAADDPTRYSAHTLEIVFRNLRAGRAGLAYPNRVDPGRGY
ncbi:MAG: D-2-hydroxyacid dehydrogenase [Rhodospirillales bacterium]|nr:D-2-hydroxyacid dehydrogenase [Rhodospirillales bacterium]MDE2199385.1 D-2-hydroxyacid dehydrogenase [Rhodospirillales bacterium]MDE2576675.1 D-2-hydroxyacid dehydrogenase [Rhodospirillales bacterium]